jgi:hypothetical protein
MDGVKASIRTKHLSRTSLERYIQTSGSLRALQQPATACILSGTFTDVTSRPHKTIPRMDYATSVICRGAEFIAVQ